MTTATASACIWVGRPGPPVALQDAEPAVARRGAKPDPLGEFGEGEAPVPLHLGKDLTVDGVRGRPWASVGMILPQRPCVRGKFGNTFSLLFPGLPPRPCGGR